MKSLINELALDTVHQLLVGQLLLLVVDHGELVGLKLVFLELCRFGYQIGELDDFSALGVTFDGLLAYVGELVNGLVVDLGEQFFGTE